MGATCSSFFVQRLSGRKYLVPNWQVCPVAASTRGALVWKVLRLAHGWAAGRSVVVTLVTMIS